MRAVCAAKSKYAHQTDRAKNQKAIDDATALELLIIELHGQQHHGEANRDPNALLDHIVKLIPVLLLRDDGRCAVDHDHAEQREPRGRSEEPFVWSELSSHLYCIKPV